MTLRSSLAIVGFLSATAAPAQLRINEVLIDPVGPNAGNQIIEIVNTSSQPFTASALWAFCIRPYYPAVPPIQVAPGGVVRVHVYATGTNTATDWYIPPALGMTELEPDGEFAIYHNRTNFDFFLNMEDFVSWGDGADFGRMDEAVAAQLWPSDSGHVALPPDEGSTAAWFGEGRGPSAFYHDGTPTLGAPNEPAAFSTFGTGCELGGETPAMDIVPGQLPWLDETYTVQITNLPPGSFPFGVVGLSDEMFVPPPDPPVDLPLDLGIFGFPGCLLYVSPNNVKPLQDSGGVANWDITLPSAFLSPFVGAEFFTQGIVLLDNPLRAGVSNAASHVIGGVR